VPPAVKTKTGFRIDCRACTKEFDSAGWAVCPSCRAKPAAERPIPSKVGRPCARPGCPHKIPRWRNGRQVSKATRFCSDKCARAAKMTGGLSNIGPPGLRRPNDKKVPVNGPLLIGPKTIPPVLRSLPEWIAAGRPVAGMPRVDLAGTEAGVVRGEDEATAKVSLANATRRKGAAS
jgi:hypothetical protein